MGHLVGQGREIVLAVLGEEHVVAERDRTAAAEPEHQPAGQTGAPAARSTVESDPAPVYRQRQLSDRPTRVGRQVPHSGHLGSRPPVPHLPRNSPIGESDSM